MAVDTTHPEYDAAAPGWEIVRDCMGGVRRMRKNATKYIPMLFKQSPLEYADYVNGAQFLNACKRTWQAFIGFVYRQNPDLKVVNSPEMERFTKDATLTGKTFYDYGKQVVGEAMAVGRRATVIDFQLLPEPRPFLVGFDTEDIINWRFGRVQNQTVLVMLTLKETVQERGDDEFQVKEAEQWRVFELLQGPEDPIGDAAMPEVTPFLRVRTYRRRSRAGTTTKKKSEPEESGFEVIREEFPNRRGFPLTRINVVFHGAEENSVCPGPVPLEDIAHINVGHYRNSADHENALHACGAPTPIAAGFDMTVEEGQAPKELTLGTSKAWVTEKADAKAYYLAYDGSAATVFTTEMEAKEKRMAALGARMLERQSSGKGQEAFETVQIRASGDMSALMTLTILNSQSLTEVLQWVMWWQDNRIVKPSDTPAEQAHYELNTEFLQMVMDAPMLSALIQANIAGKLTDEELFEQMQKGGVIPSEKTFEQHKEEVARIAFPSVVDESTGAQVDGGGQPGKSKVPPKKGGTAPVKKTTTTTKTSKKVPPQHED